MKESENGEGFKLNSLAARTTTFGGEVCFMQVNLA